MLEAKRVAVVVPAHNEAELIVGTLEGIPGFVDHVYVVDDASKLRPDRLDGHRPDPLDAGGVLCRDRGDDTHAVHAVRH